MVTQADDITRVKLRVFLQHLAIPGDQSALARAESGGAHIAVTMKAAVPWEDVGGEEANVGRGASFAFAASAKPNVRSSEQVDDKVLERGSEAQNVCLEF